MFYLTTHSTHFIYGYMASDIWLRTILIVRKETRCRHIGYSYRLTARVLLYAPSHRQDNTYHGLCYTSRGALAGTRNSSKGPPHEGSIRRPIAPLANALPLSNVPLPESERLSKTKVIWNLSHSIKQFLEMLKEIIGFLKISLCFYGICLIVKLFTKYREEDFVYLFVYIFVWLYCNDFKLKYCGQGHWPCQRLCPRAGVSET